MAKSKINLAVDSHHPNPDTRQPAAAIGSIAAVAALAVVLLARQLDVDPTVLAGVAALLGPAVTAAIIRLRVYAPATVSRLLAARGDRDSP